MDNYKGWNIEYFPADNSDSEFQPSIELCFDYDNPDSGVVFCETIFLPFETSHTQSFEYAKNYIDNELNNLA